MMKNRSSASIVAFMVIILVICAFLPVIVLRTADKITDEKVYYSEIKAIEFDNNLNSADMLYLLNNGITIDATEDEMNFKTDDLPAVIKEAISPYIKKGLISEELNEFEIRDSLAFRQYSNTDYTNTGTYWVISLDSIEPNQHFLHVLIDDSTGGIISIGYLTEENIYPSDEQSLIALHKELVDTFSDSIGVNITSYEYEDTLYDRNERVYTANTSYGDVYLNISIGYSGFSIAPAYQYEMEENNEYEAEEYVE
ncbi:MAG: hypothetical protein K6E13_11995 [Lachnospiraceae bacterium]|nr:hypothetical protein [Lachnospiraceae bacterium]